MEGVKIWEEQVVIPTYEIGEADKNPIFLDKRVYQGSTGKIYPYPTVETISDEKADKVYKAVFLENEYLRVMVLPELGGRIQRAYDKTNGYDFVYYNHVIKPALVGLTGPWISGGIEFNWPQHHRPTTYMPVDYQMKENADGSRTLQVNDVDQMYGTKGIAAFTLYPGKAYIEIRGQLYNRTPMDQTFLWWANPAVPVNDSTQSIFPPDVHAVMDHGKRDVSRFPIATGVYYKHDYSEGVDISRYKNIPVPTSYMAETSKYDFVGGYDYGVKAGILHVADHHISPGKKQWTWGCGDFGKAWDRNLTDEDGPYIELMTGVYTDNQPDFTWLKPFEEKTFKQYFMPYKEVGQVKNATIRAAVNLEAGDGGVSVCVYATQRFEGAKVRLYHGKDMIYEEEAVLSPVDIFRKTVQMEVGDETELRVEAVCGGRTLVDYQPEKQEIEKVPEPARAAREPAEIMTNEELYLTGLHIEQYRHATYLPDPYYLEGLKRDEGDIRINNAYGLLLMRRGMFGDAETYFRRAVKRATWKNPNPYNSEPYYNLGLCLWYQRRMDEAYDAFFKATWSNEQQEMSFYYLAAISAGRGDYEPALELVEKGLVKNAHNVKARGLKAYILRKLGRTEEARAWIGQNLEVDGFDYVSMFELAAVDGGECGAGRVTDRTGCGAGQALGRTGCDAGRVLDKANELMRGYSENYLQAARDFGEFGAYAEAVRVLEQCTEDRPMLFYYKAYYTGLAGCGKEKACGGADMAGCGAGMNGNDAGMNGNDAGIAGNDVGIAGNDVGIIGNDAGIAGGSFRESGDIHDMLSRAEASCPDYCFPNKLEDIQVLEYAIAQNPEGAKAYYYLGNLFYDKLQYGKATALWEKSAALDDCFHIVFRNLALSCYNKMGRRHESRNMMEKAFELAPGDARVFLELDQLYKKLGMTAAERLEYYNAHPDVFRKRDDAVIEYITLHNQLGYYGKALELIMSRRFHPWEGGEGKITTQYTVSLVEMAKQAIRSGAFDRAEELLMKALVYPENLGEGKLEGTKDNHVNYYLGCVKEAQGERDKAGEYFERACVGTDEPAGMMYYNDQPADMILYQGLAKLKLGRTREAKSRFYRLIDYGEQHLNDEMRIEYFAVSLPDFLIFEDDLNLRNKAHCCYLMGLGYLGLGSLEKENLGKAERYLGDAVGFDGNHLNAVRYLEDCREV